MPVASIQSFEGRNVAGEHSNIFNMIMLCVEVDREHLQKGEFSGTKIEGHFESLKTLEKQKQKYCF